MKISKYSIALLLITLLGFWLRTYKLSANPVSMYWDEGAIAYDAYSLSQTSKDMHSKPWYQAIFLSYGDYKAPVYLWLAAITVKIFGPTVAAVRLPSALAGTGLIILVYLIGKRLFNRPVGLLAALVVAISPWAIQFSRAAFEANVAMSLLTLAVYLALLAKRNIWLYLVSAITGAIAVYGYFSVRLVFPLVLAFAVALNRDWRLRKLLVILGTFSLFLVMLLPLVKSPYYAVSNQFRLSTRSLLNTNDHVVESSRMRDLQGDMWLSRVIYHRYVFLTKRLAINMTQNLNPGYLFFKGDPNLRHSTGVVGLFYLPMALGLIITILKHPQIHRKNILFLLGWWLVALIPASIPMEQPHALRSLNALPALSLLIGLGWWYAYEALLGKRFRTVIIAGFGIWVIISFLSYWHDYWRHYPSRSAQAWQYGYEQLAKTVGSFGPNYQQVMIEEIDRFQNYLLFFNQIDPKKLNNAHLISWNGHINFLNYQIGGQIKPGSVQEPKTLWVLTTNSYYNLQDKPEPLTIINDYQGNPAYYLLSSP